MQNYQNMPAYLPYQQPVMPQPYQDRLAQLQNSYQNTIPAQSMNSMQANIAQNNNSVLWVQGEAGAKSYLVAPGVTVLLLDSESPRMYMKSVDQSGIPSMRIFEYKEVLPDRPQASYSNANDDGSKYVTRQEFDSLKRQYEEILEQLKAHKSQQPDDDGKPAKSKSKGVIIDE